ncbi:MAG: Trehalose-6-P synthase/phosphatase complex synthase subunit [Piccolia ochrophora]|nr:MAG: Trehalose-6-P synthase/phosphatase complex synthase subunit [Piccolia ochrophora]
MPFMLPDPATTTRLLEIHQYLPFGLTPNGDGTANIIQHGGGFNTALKVPSNVLLYSIGCPSCEVPSELEDFLEVKLRETYGAIPVFLPKDVRPTFEKFCNSTIWSIFHTLPEHVAYRRDDWTAYVQANRMYAKAVAAEVCDGDMLWIHGLALMLLPEMIRAEINGRVKDVKIAFIMHTPFPSIDVLRILPVHTEVLQALLQSDFLSFHAADYVKNFLDCCSRALCLDTTPNSVQFHEQTVNVASCPYGIDLDRCKDFLRTPTGQQKLSAMTRTWRGLKVMISIDELQNTNGVLEKLYAFEALLEDHKEWIGKVILVQILITPKGSLEGGPNEGEINAVIGEIMGRYSTMDYSPIKVFGTFRFRDDFAALLAASDVYVDSSFREATSEAALHYIMTQHTNHGVLLLSQFAAPAQTMRGVYLVNPYDTLHLADTMYESLMVDAAQRRENWTQMERYVAKYSREAWVQSMLGALKKSSSRNPETRRISAESACVA